MSISGAPRVGGIGGGVGTSVVAALIEAQDLGVVTDAAAIEVLVCRSTASSVTKAIALATSVPVRPVLVVVDDCPNPWVPEVTARVKSADIDHKMRLRWIDPLRAAANPVQTAASAVWAQDERPRKWLLGLREDRDRLVTAVIDVLTERAQHAPPRPVVATAAEDFESGDGLEYRAG